VSYLSDETDLMTGPLGAFADRARDQQQIEP